LPPHTKALISVRLTDRSARRFQGKNSLIEPFLTAEQRGFYVAKAVVARPKTSNFWQEACNVPRNFIVATLSPIGLCNTRPLQQIDQSRQLGNSMACRPTARQTSSYEQTQAHILSQETACAAVTADSW